MAVEWISDIQFEELLVLVAFYDASFGIKIFPQGGFPVDCHEQESSDCHLKGYWNEYKEYINASSSYHHLNEGLLCYAV